MALARKYRLHRSSDIQTLFRKGKTVKSSFFLCKYLKNNLKHARITGIVSSKISKKATMRHQIQRRVQNALRSTFVHQGIDIVCVAHMSILRKSYEEIKRDVYENIERVVSKE